MQIPSDPIVIYSSNLCGYCTAAKRLLTQRGYEYAEVNLSNEPPSVRVELMAHTNHRTVPQIFVGGYFIGGYDELYTLNASGELDTRVQKALADLNS